jgi:hypothetical protein
MVTRSLILALCLRACHRVGPDGPETPAKTIRQASDMPRRAIAESCPAGQALVDAPQGILGCHGSDVGQCPAGHTWLFIHASLEHSLHLVTVAICGRRRDTQPLREPRPPPLRHHRMVTRSLILALCLWACHRLGPDGPETPAKTIRQASDMPRRAIAESCPAGQALVNAPQGTLGCHGSDVGQCPAGHTRLFIHASLQHSLHLVTTGFSGRARKSNHCQIARFARSVATLGYPKV